MDAYLDNFKHCFSQEEYLVLLDKRKDIKKLIGNIFGGHVNKIDLTLSSITIIAEDQGGWPFEALYMKIGTGHTTAQFYNMVIAALGVMRG